ncbi:hypothetical protein Tco_0371825 [Tanacetum coccineum]
MESQSANQKVASHRSQLLLLVQELCLLGEKVNAAVKSLVVSTDEVNVESFKDKDSWESYHELFNPFVGRQGIMDGLTLDESFIPHSLVYQEKEQEPETITEVVEILALRSNTHLIDIVDSLCDKFHIENNSLNGNPTPSSDSVVESLSPSLTPSGEIDLLLEETDDFLSLDDSIPPELLSNDSLSLPENESFHFDRYYVPSSPRPPEKPPDDDDVYFDIEPDTGVFTKVVDDISDNSTRELYVHVPNVLPTLRNLSPMFDTLLPFSSENDDKVFNLGILASNEEKSPHLLSHRGFKSFQVISDFSESPMMIYGEDIPILDVPFLHFYPP